ncbi:NADH:flavin oxidoreductase/NADH oxidase family protein [Streptomyces sp. NPDC059650]|uniref:NADH:flavin oxidoreductase/NADH oxidase family protein n=1 Tax=Streptomyces sp. NPDC059650 TaxID=3346896 RepID=UPI0036AE6130
MDHLFTQIELPCGQRLQNRLAKTAMEESMADQPGQLPGRRIETLYQRWARGGSGLIITGNVMVDRRALTSPGTIVLDAASPLDPFRRWAQAASSGGGRAWLQINHPGRQVTSDMPGTAWAPSAIGVSLGRHTKRFARPTAMTEADIQATIERFAVTAQRAEEAGFHGVQIHSAHGYLLNQFLSPLVNRRTDEWGGSLENRARLLTEVVRAVRSCVSPSLAVGIKLNASDFQRGGFDIDEATKVISLLDGLGVDLVELSGGSVESAATMGRTADDRPLDRDAYFLSLTQRLVKTATIPLMLTGGIRSREAAARVLAHGFPLVGMARALALDPDLPIRWQAGNSRQITVPRLHWRDQDLAAAGTLAYIRAQLNRLATGRTPKPDMSARWTFTLDTLQRPDALRRYRNWLKDNPAPEPKTKADFG